MFYFLLGNLRPMYRSKTKVIQLAAICKHKLIKKYKMTAVLKPIIKDLLVLVRNFTIQNCWTTLYHVATHRKMVIISQFKEGLNTFEGQLH